MARPRKPKTPFHGFDRSQEVIRLVVLMYVRFPLSPRNVEALLFERGIDISYEMVRFWWNRFGPMFAAEIRPRTPCGLGCSSRTGASFGDAPGERKTAEPRPPAPAKP